MLSGQTVGPYIIEQPLGAGGMASLHRARHTSTNQVVALKSVAHAVRLNLRSLRREIRALRAVAHPNVVRIIDADTESSPPWYAMELIDGLPLNKHWMVVDVSERWQQYLRAFADICDGLAYMHGLGMVHRDLKPANVVLRSSPREYAEAVVVDFGLATISGGGSGREQLYKRSEVIGTPQYISPEQVKQGHVDARTDLYALGCMLYEVVVGRTPFPADVPFAAMLKHVNETPEFPREVLDRVPPQLAELIHAMLEKEPRNRPGYATDVRNVLATLGDVGSSPQQKPIPKTYLHRPEFVGRESLGQDFSQAAYEVTLNKGSVTSIRGPAGAGKSRVAIELIRELHIAANDHLEVLVAESPNSATSAPLASLRTVFDEIADICTERGPGFTAHIFGPEARLLSRYFPAIENLAGIELGDETLVPEVVETATLEAVSTVFERMAREKPLVIALDDVQWCDPLTKQWLERLHVRAPWDNVPLMLILVGRSEDETNSVPPRVLTEPDRHLEIGPLSVQALKEMVQSMTGIAEIPNDFFAAIMLDAAGLPSRAAQWLQAAVSRGALVRDFGRWRFQGMPIENAEIHDTVATSLTFDDLLSARIASLRDGHRSVMELAVVLGPELRPEVLANLGSNELSIIDDLIADGVLVEHMRGAVRFATPELYESAKSALGERTRRELHVRAAAILESVGAPEVEIAHHLALAGWRDEARTRLFREADSAFDRGEWVQADRLYRALADLGFKTADREVTGWSRLAVLARRNTQFDEARAALEKAKLSAASKPASPLARAEYWRAKGLLERHSDPTMSLESLRQAQELFAESGEWLDERNVSIEVGNALCRTGEVEQGRVEYMSVHDRARQNDDEEGVATALASVGATWIASRRFEVAEDLLGRAAARFRELHIPHRLADALYNLGICYVDQGRGDAAASLFEEVAALRAASGDLRGSATAESARGHAMIVSDRFSEAREVLASAVETLERSDDRFALAIALGYSGQANAYLKRYSDAMDHFVRALTIHGAMPQSTVAPYVHVDIAELERRLGMYEDARVQLDKAEAFAVDDPLLRVQVTVQRSLLQLAATGRAAVDTRDLKRQLEEMHLPQTSLVARQLTALERALSVPRAQLQHGETLQSLPPAFCQK